LYFQPKGAGTTHKEGTVVVQSPKATGWGGSNVTIDTYVSNLPTTGVINNALSGLYNNITYYTT